MLIAVSVSLISTWALLFFLLPILRTILLDYPNNRSSHCLPTPRGGGLAFVIVAVIGSFFVDLLGFGGWSGLLIACCLPLAVVGLFDDYSDISPLWRFCFQSLTAVSILLISPLFRSLVVILPSSLLAISALLALIMITACINLVNFMDGLDGLVASCMVVVFSVSCIHIRDAFCLWILIGGLLGFLLWNWFPAKVFMGDVGSTFLGAVWAGVLLHSPNWHDAIGLLLVSTPLLADSLSCIPRRLTAGHQIFLPHRLHLFQRLHQAGWSHSGVAFLYVSATIILGVTFLVGPLAVVSVVSFSVFSIGVWLDQRVAVSFSESLSGNSKS